MRFDGGGGTHFPFRRGELYACFCRVRPLQDEDKKLSGKGFISTYLITSTFGVNDRRFHRSLINRYFVGRASQRCRCINVIILANRVDGFQGPTGYDASALIFVRNSASSFATSTSNGSQVTLSNFGNRYREVYGIKVITALN